MNKKLLAFIIIILLIINSIGAALIFIDIQMFEFPGTTLRIDLIEVNSDEAILHHDLQIHNPNVFDLILQDFQILATASNGVQLADLAIEGGTVPAGGSRSYSADDQISLSGNLSGDITTKVTGTVGINILGIIKKTIPLEVTVLTSLNDILEDIAAPIIGVRTAFGNITSTEIDMTADIDITNPNTINITLDTITLDFTSETGKSEGSFTIAGGLIPAKGTVTLHGQGAVLFDALNAKQLSITAITEISVAIAGYNKTLPFASTIDVTVPPLEDYLTKEKPLELSLDIDFRAKMRGLDGNITLTLDNPTVIGLFASDIFIDYYRIDHGNKTYITRSYITGGELVPHNVTIFKGEILIPFSEIIKPLKYRSILPDSFFARLNVNLSVAGINQSIWIGLGSYVDIKLFRFNQ